MNKREIHAPRQLVLLHILAGAVATGTLAVAFRFAGTTAVATGTQCNVLVIIIGLFGIVHGIGGWHTDDNIIIMS